MSDGSLVIEEYYNQNNSGFGAFLKLPPSPPDGYAPFGPGFMNDARNKPWRLRTARQRQGDLVPDAVHADWLGVVDAVRVGLRRPGQFVGARRQGIAEGRQVHAPVGRTEQSSADVLLPGPVNHQYTYLPQLDGGIYLLKNGEIVDQPSQLRLIKNDPNYNECWPRAVVPYSRICGMKEPKALPTLANDGSKSKHLPEGTPFGLVGSSSLYKRESYPNGVVRDGEVTSTFSGGRDPWRGLDAFTSHGNGMPLNWHNQGADAGLYSNDEIHAVRIIAMEPTTDRHRGEKSGRRFFNHASERFRILGEIPVRKLAADGTQPRDPDGNPDTSFLAKIPADTAFTFQTLDARGLVLNMGADVASTPPRRSSARLRRLSRSQSEADRVLADRCREAGLRGLGFGQFDAAAGNHPQPIWRAGGGQPSNSCGGQASGG